MEIDKKILEICERRKFTSFWEILDYLTLANYEEVEAMMISLEIFKGDIWNRVIDVHQKSIYTTDNAIFEGNNVATSASSFTINVDQIEPEEIDNLINLFDNNNQYQNNNIIPRWDGNRLRQEEERLIRLRQRVDELVRFNQANDDECVEEHCAYGLVEDVGCDEMAETPIMENNRDVVINNEPCVSQPDNLVVEVHLMTENANEDFLPLYKAYIRTKIYEPLTEFDNQIKTIRIQLKTHLGIQLVQDGLNKFYNR